MITKASVIESVEKRERGCVVSVENRGGIVTSDGLLEIQRLQLEGKKECSFQDFIRGYPDFIGATLE